MDTKGNITMNIEQRKEYIWQGVERFINENYGLEATRVDFRDIPEGGISGDVSRDQIKHRQYALIFDIPGMVRKTLYIPGLSPDPMEEYAQAQFRTWVDNHLSSRLPSILGL